MVDPVVLKGEDTNFWIEQKWGGGEGRWFDGVNNEDRHSITQRQARKGLLKATIRGGCSIRKDALASRQGAKLARKMQLNAISRRRKGAEKGAEGLQFNAPRRKASRKAKRARNSKKQQYVQCYRDRLISSFARVTLGVNNLKVFPGVIHQRRLKRMRLAHRSQVLLMRGDAGWGGLR